MLYLGIETSESIEKLAVGTLGFQTIQIPILRKKATDSPRVCLIAGIHGDETSSLLVLRRFLEMLPPLRKGCLEILFCANPLARMENARRSSIDQKDLNRSFSGSGATITSQTAHTLLSFLEGADLVIDLHEFEIQTPLLGILIETQNRNLRKKNEHMMRIFSPTQCWILRHQRKEERHFEQCLGAALNERGIMNFAVELNASAVIQQKELQQCARKILNLLSSLKMISRRALNNKTFPFFERQEIVASEEGIFTPIVRVLAEVHKGDLLGTLSNPLLRTSSEIRSPVAGTVMQLSRERFVSLGSLVAAMGQEDKGR